MTINCRFLADSESVQNRPLQRSQEDSDGETTKELVKRDVADKSKVPVKISPCPSTQEVPSKKRPGLGRKKAKCSVQRAKDGKSTIKSATSTKSPHVGENAESKIKKLAARTKNVMGKTKKVMVKRKNLGSTASKDKPTKLAQEKSKAIRAKNSKGSSKVKANCRIKSSTSVNSAFFDESSHQDSYEDSHELDASFPSDASAGDARDMPDPFTKRVISLNDTNRIASEGCLPRSTIFADDVSVAGSNIYDRVKKRKRRELSASEPVCHGKVRKIPRVNGRLGCPSLPSEQDPEASNNEVFDGAMGASSEESDDLLIQVKKEVKLENAGDDTDDTRSYLDDDLEDELDALSDVKAPSIDENSSSALKSNDLTSYLRSKKWVKTMKPSGEMVLISESDFTSLSSGSRDGSVTNDLKPNVGEDSESQDVPADGPGGTDALNAGACDEESQENEIVTLCYFCLSETVFFDGSIDHFRGHLWEHLLECDINDNCPLDCDAVFNGDFRALALHFFEMHQFLPPVLCSQCGDKFLFDLELTSHVCSIKNAL